MSVFIGFGLLLPILIGFLSLAAFWPAGRSLVRDTGLIVSLGTGLGLGVTSLVFVGVSMVVAHPVWIEFGIEVAACALLGLAARSRLAVEKAKPAGPPVEFTWLGLVLGAAFACALLAASTSSFRSWCAEPLGSWDGWAIWNMRARTIDRAGAGWEHLLQAKAMSWSHLDYPLLVPGTVARIWAFAGTESAADAGAVSALFGVSALGTLVFAVASMRGLAVALIAGLILVSTPFFVTFSSNEHADIPVAAYLLCAVAASILARSTSGRGLFAGVAGLCIGLGAWTKNEGLLGAAVVGGLFVIDALLARDVRRLRVFLGAAACLMAPLILFKLCLAPGNEIVGGSLGGRLHQVLDLRRHAMIWRALVRDLPGFGQWKVVPYVPLAILLIGRPRADWRGILFSAVLPVGMIAVGYYAIYLVTPMDLEWHLNTSLVRLLVQLWPSFLFACCLWMPEARTAVLEARPSGRAVAAVGILTGLGLSATGWLLQGQPSRDELARLPGDRRVAVYLDGGWYEPESDAHTSWVWSEGWTGLLRIEDNRSEASRSVLLRFKIRKLTQAPGNLLMRVNGRLDVGTVAVTQAWQAVSVRVPLSGKATEFSFQGFLPPLREGDGPEARTLGFALTEVSLK